MARPTKEGLDYFPLDIGVDQDDKLVVPIAKFGMRGFGVIVKLMMEVYRNGYYYAWTEKEVYVFSKRINDDINFVSDVINECIKWGFFSQELFEEHQILTSAGFQKRYVEASRRRKAITFIDCYTLIDLSVACEKVLHPIIEVDADGNEVNVYINPSSCTESDAESTQSKKKVNRNRNRKEIKDKEVKNVYAESVSLTDSQYQKLIVKYGSEESVKWAIDKLSNYKCSRKTKYTSDYHVLIGWVYEDFTKKKIKEDQNAAAGKGVENPNAGVDFGF